MTQLNGGDTLNVLYFHSTLLKDKKKKKRNFVVLEEGAAFPLIGGLSVCNQEGEYVICEV